MFGLNGSMSTGSNSALNAMDGSDGAFSLFGSSWTLYAGALILIVLLVAVGILLLKLMLDSSKLGGNEKERFLSVEKLKSNSSRIFIVVFSTIAFWALLTTWFSLVL